MQRVIFACVHNAGRSQMAAAFLSALADPSKVEAVSAGTKPGERVHPEVVDVIARDWDRCRNKASSEADGATRNRRRPPGDDGVRRRMSFRTRAQTR